ncbi:hypothetical protein [Streptomyces sp. NTK 937]|uniref:hypothetical protein n=1 Tax=Streptomyces sp. NTK 937 TaxID=1487711 RepID=UPI0004A8FEE6|nr:hypothetical protein [Streptomyces sp. NTK 937]KDQ65737.1 hypothetical protein DT87_00330 [Streptomyces sp. NTK 937]
MSAWAELVNADGSDEWLELCSRALEEVQEETLRRAARKIRSHPECEVGGYGDGILDASYMVDPDVEDEEDDVEDPRA